MGALLLGLLPQIRPFPRLAHKLGPLLLSDHDCLPGRECEREVAVLDLSGSRHRDAINGDVGKPDGSHPNPIHSKLPRLARAAVAAVGEGRGLLLPDHD